MQRWYIPFANFDRQAFQPLWLTSYTHPFREPLSSVGRWGIDYLKTPHGMGPTDRRHTTVFPDKEWARGQDPVFRQIGNRALALWRGDSLPVIPTWEDQAELAAELLDDELTFDALGRFAPVYTESYVQCLTVSHLLWWDHWRIFFNVRKGLRRLARLEGSVATLPRGPTLGWGGYRPHRHWDALPGVAPAGGAQHGALIDVWGPRPLGPTQGRAGTFDYVAESDLAKDRGLPHRVGPTRAYGGRRGGNRLNQEEWASHSLGLDPAALPWGVQAWLRGLDLRSAGDALAPSVTWLGGWWAGLLGREAWPSAQGWGGALGLAPHLRRSPLGSWAPGLWVPLFGHRRYSETELHAAAPRRWGGYSVSARGGPAGPWVYTPRTQFRPTWWGRRLPSDSSRLPFIYFNPQILHRPNPWAWKPVRTYLLPLYPFSYRPRLPMPPLFVPHPIPKDLLAYAYGHDTPRPAPGAPGPGGGEAPGVARCPLYRPIKYPTQIVDPLFLAPYGLTLQRIPLWDFISDSRWHGPAVTAEARPLGLRGPSSALPYGFQGTYSHDMWVRWFRTYPFFRTYLEVGRRSSAAW